MARSRGMTAKATERIGKGKVFFFEKKKQKTFFYWCVHRPICDSGVVKLPKVFWFFFAKKNTSSTP
jgi:hypothetical protein